MFYAGVGSRETPEDVCKTMRNLAIVLWKKGYTLRSGGAKGADTAFELGAGPKKEIFLAKDATPEAIEMAAKFHPAWNRCDPSARKLHARNCMIMLGRDLKEEDAVKFVIAWTKDGKASGGTGQALRMAEHYNIPIYNLKNMTGQEILEKLK